ncbi:MAG: hypothetical protein M3R63_09245 [Actinomycetota bacterium]|nr:hypothetical protein [Actinomycetota bacterium]
MGRRDVIGAPILTALPRTVFRWPVIPFIELAEGLVITTMQRSGVPLQRIRPALERLDEELGPRYALANKRPGGCRTGRARRMPSSGHGSRSKTRQTSGSGSADHAQAASADRDEL